MSELTFAGLCGVKCIQHEPLLPGAKSLELLDLSHNSLVRLSTSQFVELGRLHTLNVSYNELTLVSPGAFTGLSSLELLDASQNLLREVFLDEDDLRNVHLFRSQSMRCTQLVKR